MERISSRLGIFDRTPEDFRNLIRHAEPRERPTTTAEMWNVAMPADRRSRGILNDGGLHQTVRIDVEEGSSARPKGQEKCRRVWGGCNLIGSECVLPTKADGAPLAGKLKILKRREMKFLNLLDKHLFLGLRDKIRLINKSIRNLRRAGKQAQVSIDSGHISR